MHVVCLPWSVSLHALFALNIVCYWLRHACKFLIHCDLWAGFMCCFVCLSIIIVREFDVRSAGAHLQSASEFFLLFWFFSLLQAALLALTSLEVDQRCLNLGVWSEHRIILNTTLMSAYHWVISNIHLTPANISGVTCVHEIFSKLLDTWQLCSL